MIDKDIQITNEVYSIQGVEFDRQVIFCSMLDQVYAFLYLLELSESEQLLAKTYIILLDSDYFKSLFQIYHTDGWNAGTT